MSPTGTLRMLVIGIVVVLVIGSVDSAIGGEWDLFALFLIALGLGVTLLFRVESRRSAIPIRRDLAAWLRNRSAVSGEPLTTVTDRAIATFVERYGAVTDVEEARQ